MDKTLRWVHRQASQPEDVHLLGALGSMLCCADRSSPMPAKMQTNAALDYTYDGPVRSADDRTLQKAWVAVKQRAEDARAVQEARLSRRPRDTHASEWPTQAALIRIRTPPDQPQLPRARGSWRKGSTCACMCVASGVGVSVAPAFVPVSFVIQARREDCLEQTRGGDFFAVRVLKEEAVVRRSLALAALAEQSPLALRLFLDLAAVLDRQHTRPMDFLSELYATSTSSGVTYGTLSKVLRSIGVSFADAALRDLLLNSLDGDGNSDGDCNGDGDRQIDHFKLSSLFKSLTKGDEAITPSVRDNGDGTYVVEYVISAAISAFEVEVMLEDEHISGSPFKVRVSW